MRTHKILIVDNDPNFLFVLAKWLASPLYEIVCVESAEAAASQIKEYEWDLIISDVNLPKKSGIDLLTEVKSGDKNANVILISGYATLSMAMDAINKQADMFLLKPFSKATLLEKVKQTLQASKQAKSKTILAIGAHPDDVEIGCGGALLKHSHAGDEIHILTLTYGAHGGDSALRFNEAKRAAQALGAILHIENLLDTQIQESGDTIKCIERVVSKLKPDLVYTHSINDSHQDHRNVHKASMVACRSIANIECYQSPSSTIAFQPNHFVDISRELSEKLSLLHCYQSQVKKCNYLEDSLIEANARYWGRFANYTLVEPMEVMRTL